MNPYSASLFEHMPEKVISENFLEEAGEGSICFVEDQMLLPYEEKIEKIIVYRWNREYPKDLTLDLPMGAPWKLISTTEFPGFSHEKITKEAYTK